MGGLPTNGSCMCRSSGHPARARLAPRLPQRTGEHGHLVERGRRRNTAEAAAVERRQHHPGHDAADGCVDARGPSTPLDVADWACARLNEFFHTICVSIGDLDLGIAGYSREIAPPQSANESDRREWLFIQ